MNIYDDICTLKGIGPKTKELLNQCGIFNILDFLLYFPRDYEYNEQCFKICEAIENTKIVINAKVISIKRDIYIRKNMIITTVVLSDGNEEFEAKWFNQPYIKNKFRTGTYYTLKGKVEIKGRKRTLVNSKIVENENDNFITPKYPLKEGLTNSLFMKINKNIIDNILVEDNLPYGFLEKYELCSLDEAIKNIHNPSNVEKLELAKKRLKFQEFFTYSLKLFMIKKLRKNQGISFNIAKELSELKEKMPFELTSAQSKVVREILLDEKKDIAMNRLVQGDVGSGKTIVSIIALLNVVKNGYQAAMMAPTEILATQHYEEIKKILQDFHVKIELLCGSTSMKHKREIKEELKNGKIDIIIGTHALIEGDVEFQNLGIVVTDEQHRFGVNQRSKLFNKAKKADILVMTATPIPRTLALTLYGDLDISSIDELPPGRKKVDTYFVNKTMRKRVYGFALKEIQKGRQVYIVCPLVEENESINVTSVEELYNELKESIFVDTNVGIIHGKMSSKDKDEIMNKFKRKDIDVLISTTVIEVGVNVPNATLMIIENAERFGLSQLHQLRGRVGRGSEKSYCVLIAEANSNITKKRMDIMTKSNDGFYIAEEDLKLRGSGEIFGVSQHGEDEFILGDVVDDIHLFREANNEAKRVVNSELEKDINIKNEILENLEKTSRYICFN